MFHKRRNVSQKEEDDLLDATRTADSAEGDDTKRTDSVAVFYYI